MIFDLASVEQKIGYVFKDKMLLRKCFTHASYAYENNTEDNEVLEFFGDAIIQFIVTEQLYRKVDRPEGVLTEMRADIVSKQPLQDVVFSLGLDKFALLGEGQAKSLSKNSKLFSSIYEALVAGIYLDGGMASAKKFVKNTLIKQHAIKKPRKKEQIFSAKSILQEFVQKHKLGDITYELVSKNGPEHNPEFKVNVVLNGKVIACGTGSNKKSAQTQGAQIALKKLSKV